VDNGTISQRGAHPIAMAEYLVLLLLFACGCYITLSLRLARLSSKQRCKKRKLESKSSMTLDGCHNNAGIMESWSQCK